MFRLTYNRLFYFKNQKVRENILTLFRINEIFAFRFNLLNKYANKQIKLNLFTILVALGQYETMLQSRTAKKYYNFLSSCNNSQSKVFLKMLHF